jgi:hypothetical protein
LADLPHVCLQQQATVAAEAFQSTAIKAQVVSISPAINQTADTASAHPDASGTVAVVLAMNGDAAALPIGLPVNVHFQPCPTKS